MRISGYNTHGNRFLGLVCQRQEEMKLSSGFIHQRNRYRSITASIKQMPKREAKINNGFCAVGGAVSTLCRKGRVEEALGILHSTNQQGMVESSTYASVLQACTSAKDCKQIHAHLIESGIERNTYLGTKLISVYARYGNMLDARQVFEKMPTRNVFSWTAMLGEYARHGHYEEALELYHQMQRSGLQPDSFVFPCVLKACSGLAALEDGEEIHDCIARNGFESDVFVGNALIDMYAKCRSIEAARNVFDKMPERDVVSWNTMISGYAHNGRCDEALKLFCQMQVSGTEPNVITWTAMIGGYAQNGLGDDALKFFHQMQLAGLKPNLLTVASVLTVYAQLAASQRGREIHNYIIKRGFGTNLVVASTLVTMYTKCGSLKDARQVFDKMSQTDAVSWTALIAGYAQNGYDDEALKLFCQMQLAGKKSDLVTIASVLPACAHLAALQQGKQLHDYIIRRQFESDVVVGSALIAMYAKCGSIDNARQVFDKMSQRDVVLWNAMIAGYAMHGHGEDALTLFYEMQNAGMRPDSVTFTGVLSACSHGGLVNKGWEYFDLMSREYCITPSVEHYACMVDLLGRVGCLNAAYDFINKMPLEPNAPVWGALLGACIANCSTELGERAAERLFDLEPLNVVNYVVLSNIYAATGRWEDVGKIRKTMKDRGLRKRPGCSWIEVKNRVHKFLAGDRSHTQTHRIYAMLEILAGQMEEAGYVPDMNFALHDVEDNPFCMPTMRSY